MVIPRYRDITTTNVHFHTGVDLSGGGCGGGGAFSDDVVVGVDGIGGGGGAGVWYQCIGWWCRDAMVVVVM